jgi:AcrR family transcriptional regulator
MTTIRPETTREADETDEATPLPTRARQRLDTRNLIYRVALAEIAQVGLAGARIEHIARKAGVTRPTIYAHFPSKEDFLRELQSRTENRALVELRRRLEEDAGRGLVHRLTDAIFDLLGDVDATLRRESFALIVREARQALWMGSGLFGFVRDELEAAQQDGEISDAISPDELTRILTTALFGFLVIEDEPREERRRAAHRMLDLLISGAAMGTKEKKQ